MSPSRTNDRLAYLARRLRLTYAWAPRRWHRLRTLLRTARSPRAALDCCFAALDLTGFFDLYEGLTNALFPSTRPLTPGELLVLRPVFKDSVPYDLIRVDERAYLGPSWARFFYVSFHTINAWGRMSDPTLVHEVVHVWQYTHRGAAYIPRALYAQTTPAGYNYGGLEELERHNRLEDFNYEQQADIIEDFYRLTHGYPAQWVPGRGAEVLPAFYPYVGELTNRKS